MMNPCWLVSRENNIAFLLLTVYIFSCINKQQFHLKLDMAKREPSTTSRFKRIFMSSDSDEEMSICGPEEEEIDTTITTTTTDNNNSMLKNSTSPSSLLLYSPHSPTSSDILLLTDGDNTLPPLTTNDCDTTTNDCDTTTNNCDPTTDCDTITTMNWGDDDNNNNIVDNNSDTCPLIQHLENFLPKEENYLKLWAIKKQNRFQAPNYTLINHTFDVATFKGLFTLSSDVSIPKSIVYHVQELLVIEYTILSEEEGIRKKFFLPVNFIKTMKPKKEPNLIIAKIIEYCTEWTLRKFESIVHGLKKCQKYLSPSTYYILCNEDNVENCTLKIKPKTSPESYVPSNFKQTRKLCERLYNPHTIPFNPNRSSPPYNRPYYYNNNNNNYRPPPYRYENRPSYGDSRRPPYRYETRSYGDNRRPYRSQPYENRSYEDRDRPHENRQYTLKR